jgi:hypothetical protein
MFQVVHIPGNDFVFPFSIKPITELTDKIAPADEVFGDEINGLILRMKGQERAGKIELKRKLKRFSREAAGQTDVEFLQDH